VSVLNLYDIITPFGGGAHFGPSSLEIILGTAPAAMAVLATFGSGLLA
jgi:hypothetical protein